MNADFIADITSQIEIPTDGILSRVLHSDTHLRLVGFGFDTGQELTEHSSVRPIIVQVVTGSIDVSAEGITHAMGPSSWITLAPNVPHSVMAREPSIVLLTLLASTP